MVDYRIELQAFVDAAASFVEPALGHHKAWAEAVARARVALSVPESSANTVCSITPPPELVEEWANLSARTYRENGTYAQHEFALATQAARWGADQELEACCELLEDHDCEDPQEAAKRLRDARRPSKQPPTADELIKLAEAMRGIAVHDGRWLDELERVAQLLEQQACALQQTS